MAGGRRVPQLARGKWGLGDPRRRRPLFVVAVVGALTTLPLLGTLGYESGFLLSPLFAGLGMGIAVDAVHERRRRLAAGEDSRPLATTIATDLGIVLGLALGVLLLGRLWQPGCDTGGGFKFYVMGPVASGVMGVAAGLWSGVLTERRARGLWLGAVPIVVSTGIGVHRILVDPVVFAYDPFWGYFSGSVYDEAVSVTRTYVEFRLYNLIAWGAALCLWRFFVDPGTAEPRRPRRGSPAVLWGLTAAALGGFALWIGLRPTERGFTADLDSISDTLTGTHESEHFVIHYAPRSSEARTIELVAAEHEFAWARLRDIMNGREPSEKVHSFVFASPEQKRALMGAGTVQVAAPWRNQIYLDHREFPHPVLHHELAHIFGATVGDSLLGISRDGLKVNVGLIEGFATALAPRPADHLDLHDQALVLRRLELLPSIGAIMGPGFFAKSSRVAYTAAGSLCLWLLETRGFEPLGMLYGTAGDFQRAYGESLEDLEAQWLAFLDARPGVSDEDVDGLAQRFKRRSVFQRPCAHRVAEVQDEIARALTGGNFDDAVENYRELCSLEPDMPMHYVGLARGLAVSGEFADALVVLSEASALPELTVTLQATIAEHRGDVELARGNLEAAAEAYRIALALPLEDDQRRILQLKLEGTEDDRLAVVMVDYFAPFDPLDTGHIRSIARLYGAMQIHQMPGRRGLGAYLVARQLLNVDRHADAPPLLREALEDASALPSPTFLRAAREALLVSELAVGRYDAARAVLDQLQREPGLGNGHRLEYDLWAERIEFFEGYRGSAD